MGSSNKVRKHYKKDSRFVADLYTFTYDDFDLVRDARRAGRRATANLNELCVILTRRDMSNVRG